MPEVRTLSLGAASFGDLATIREFVCRAALDLGAAPEAADDLVIAVDETATNVVRHGYRTAPGPLDVEVARHGETIEVRLRDAAPPFDPTGQPSPDLTVPLEERAPGGLGIHLARASVDAMRHRTLAPAGGGTGNELTMARAISGARRETL